MDRLTKKLNKIGVSIISVLGSGAFGKVYLIQGNLSRRKTLFQKIWDWIFSYRYQSLKLYALKVPLTKKANLYNEAKILSGIRSEYVVKLNGVIRHRGHILGIITEYVPGHNLTYYYQKNLLTSQYLTQILNQLLIGIKEIHALGIAHRDIKLDNIIYDPDTQKIKIIDFGISTTSSSTRICGTLNYMSSELIQTMAISKTTTLDIMQRSDLYAIGVVMYMLVNGHRPSRTEYIPSGFGKDNYEDIHTRIDELLGN